MAPWSKEEDENRSLAVSHGDGGGTERWKILATSVQGGATYIARSVAALTIRFIRLVWVVYSVFLFLVVEIILRTKSIYR